MSDKKSYFAFVVECISFFFLIWFFIISNLQNIWKSTKN